MSGLFFHRYKVKKKSKRNTKECNVSMLAIWSQNMKFYKDVEDKYTKFKSYQGIVEEHIGT